MLTNTKHATCALAVVFGICCGCGEVQAYPSMLLGDAVVADEATPVYQEKKGT